MKSIFYLKRNAHRMVNILFYVGFFIAGYICAKSTSFKIDMIKEFFTW